MAGVPRFKRLGAKQIINEPKARTKTTGIIPVTFLCNDSVINNFRSHCLARDKSPNKTIERLLKQFNDKCLDQDMRGF